MSSKNLFPLAIVAFALLIVAMNTFYVLKQTGRRKSMTKSYDDAKPAIRNKLFRENRLKAQKDFVDTLRGKSKIEINEANLAKVRIDTSMTQDDGRGTDSGPPPLAPAPLPGNPQP